MSLQFRARRQHLLVLWAAFCIPALSHVATVSAQTMGVGGPVGQVHDLGNGNRIQCCPSPLIWGFDPYGLGTCDGNCGNGCRDWFIAHRPATWYGSADYVAMTRDPSSDVLLARIGPTGAAALSSGNLQSEFDSGARFTVGRTLGDCYQAEVTYLGNYGWSDTLTIANSTTNGLGTTGDLSSVLSNFAVPRVDGLDYNQTATAAMSASMISAEANIRTWTAMPPGPFDVQFLVGARYLKAKDTLQYHTVSQSPAPGGSVNDVIVGANNDLYGVQVGLDGKFLITTTFFVDFEAKGAICANFASQDSNYAQTDSTGTTSTYLTSASANRTAFLGDFTLTANWQLRPNVTIRAGYQAIFVNGLALAPQNIQPNNVLLKDGPGQLVDNGNLVYHGPVIGLVGAW